MRCHGIQVAVRGRDRAEPTGGVGRSAEDAAGLRTARSACGAFVLSCAFCGKDKVSCP